MSGSLTVPAEAEIEVVRSYDIGDERIQQGLCPICGQEPKGEPREAEVLPHAGKGCLERLQQIRSDQTVSVANLFDSSGK